MLPNGVDTDYFTLPKNKTPVPGRIVFLGPTYMFPNRDSVDYFLKEIWPSIRKVNRSASLNLIGRSTEDDQTRYNSQPYVTSLGHVDDIRPNLAEACCSIVPLRIGGGTRLKILDSWAMGKAVISTSIGCEGLRAVDEDNILIRDDPKDFADAVVQVISDSKLRSKLGENGRKTVEKYYSWEIVGRNMRGHYWCFCRRF